MENVNSTKKKTNGASQGDYFYEHKTDAMRKADDLRANGYKVAVRKARGDRKGEWIVITSGRKEGA